MANGICDICKRRPASFRAQVSVNGERQVMELCDDDYRKLARQQRRSSSPLESLFGGGSLFDEFFGDSPLGGMDRRIGDESEGQRIPVNRGSRRGQGGASIADRLSEQGNKLLQEAAQKAGELGRSEVDTEHLLFALSHSDVVRTLLEQFKIDVDDLRRQIALVSQDTYLFNASIRDNLRLGKIEASDSEVEAAAQQANAHEFITAFPDGYDTLVGERGMQLSGGQRQRVSIARAILKNAPVLILDEATSHLDAVNERQVRQALETLMAGRTTVVIAHRLSTIRDADRIVVLDNGHAVEQGSHHDLLASHGLYSQLVATQLVGATAGDEHNGHREEHGGHDDHRLGSLPDMPDVNPHHHH